MSAKRYRVSGELIEINARWAKLQSYPVFVTDIDHSRCAAQAVPLIQELLDSLNFFSQDGHLPIARECESWLKEWRE